MADLCQRLGFDHTLYVTVPVWFSTGLSTDVSSVGVQDCSVEYIVLVFRFLQREVNLVTRGARDRTNPSGLSVYVDILRPPDTVTMHGAHRNLAYAESRGLLKEHLVKGHLFHLGETGVWDDGANLLLTDLVTASNQVPAFREYEITFRSLCVRKRGHDGINEMFDIYDHEYLLGSDSETRQVYNSVEWSTGSEPAQTLRTMVRLGRSLHKADSDILADWVAVMRQARSSQQHPNRPGEQEQVNKVVDTFAYRGVVHSSVQALERSLTDHGVASKPLAAAATSRGRAAGAHLTEAADAEQVMAAMRADLAGDNGVDAAAIAMAALNIRPGAGGFRPGGAGPPGGGGRSELIRGPLFLDKILASPDCPPRLKGLVRNPLVNPQRADGMYGRECFCCKKFETRAVDDETHRDFIAKYGSVRSNPLCRVHLIVHGEPYCRNVRMQVQDHVKTNPQCAWMEERDLEFDKKFEDEKAARAPPS